MNQEIEYINFIKEKINNNKVVLFIKGEKENPLCGFSFHAVRIIKDLNCEFETVDVLESNQLKESLKVFSNWPTIPQLYIDQKFIGGCDIMIEMHQNGDLEKILN